MVRKDRAPSHILLFASLTLFFSVIPLRALASPDRPGAIIFSALFKLTDAKHASRPAFRLVIHETPSGIPGARLKAKIQARGKTIAHCAVAAPEVAPQVASNKAAYSITAVSFGLSCRSAQFDTLEAPATLTYSRSAAPKLFFGTWLSGYRDTVLKIEVDRYSQPHPVRVGHGIAISVESERKAIDIILSARRPGAPAPRLAHAASVKRAN